MNQSEEFLTRTISPVAHGLQGTICRKGQEAPGS